MLSGMSVIRSIQQAGAPAELEIVQSESSATAIISTAADYTIVMPSGITDGNLLLLWTGYSNDNQFPLPAGGWSKNTALESPQSGGGDSLTSLYTKIASSEPSSYNVTVTATDVEYGAIVVEIAGFDAGIFDVTPVSGHRAFGQNDPTPPTTNITTNTDKAIVFWHQWLRNAGGSFVGVEPSGQTMLETRSGGPIGAPGHSVAYAIIDPAAAVAVGSWENTGGAAATEYNGCTLVIKPE